MPYHLCFSYIKQVLSILETTVEHSRQREAVIDEALASTDISVARSQLEKQLDGYDESNESSNQINDSITAIENTAEEKEKDDND